MHRGAGRDSGPFAIEGKIMGTNSTVRPDGFTLVEMAIVMMISGLLLSGATTMLGTYMKHSKLQETKDNLQRIESALQSYYVMNGNFPCPAKRTANPADTDYGRAKEECFDPDNLLTTRDPGIAYINNPDKKSIVAGILPFRSLGIPDNHGHDGWGNSFEYAVTGSLTLASEFSQTDGAIDIVAEDGQSRLTPSHTAQYVVISHGPNKLGGYIAGQQDMPCPTGTAEAENCDDDGVFMDALRMDGASRYDDVIFYTQYDPDLEANGGLLIQYKNSCAKDFSKVKIDGDMPVGIETLAKDAATLKDRNGDGFVLCYSSRYTVKMAYPSELKADSPQCPERWTFIGYKFLAYDDDPNGETAISETNRFAVCAR